ncbi:MAG: hypothetical protein IPH86_02890 [bacterium]|nr:hypothetical protein [bacterium]
MEQEIPSWGLAGAVAAGPAAAMPVVRIRKMVAARACCWRTMMFMPADIGGDLLFFNHI